MKENKKLLTISLEHYLGKEKLTIGDVELTGIFIENKWHERNWDELELWVKHKKYDAIVDIQPAGGGGGGSSYSAVYATGVKIKKPKKIEEALPPAKEDYSLLIWS